MQLFLPDELSALVAGKAFSQESIGHSGACVLLFEDMVLKISPVDAAACDEHTIMRALEGLLPLPRLLHHCVMDGSSYLLMTRVKGKMACDAEFVCSPQRLVDLLAEALRSLWSVDTRACPVRWTLDEKLAAAERNVAEGRVDVCEADCGTFGPDGFSDPSELLLWLENNRPDEEPVVSHGDFCLPNVFFDENGLCGFVDLGMMGLADRWQDIALCWRSLRDNLCGRYASEYRCDFEPDTLFDALGIEKNEEKLRYYLLLDELF